MPPDYVITGGTISAFPAKHYGGHSVGSRYTFCEDSDLLNPSANVQAIPGTPVKVLSSGPVSVGREFFGMTVQLRANDLLTGITGNTVRSHDIANGASRWQIIQPVLNTNVAAWNLTALDQWVDTHWRAGRDLVVTLFATPSWISTRPSETSAYKYGVYGTGTAGPDYGNFGLAAEPFDMAYWDAYCSALATRYLGKVKYYEVWNEPNLTGFFTGTKTILAQMVRRANIAIKTVDPTAKIISPAITNWSATASQSAETFLTQMMAASDGATGTMKDWVDIVGVHLYLPTGNKVGDLAGMIDRITAAKATAGISSLPVWDTESSPITAAIGLLSNLSAITLLPRMLITMAAKGIARTIYYQYDSPTMGFYQRDPVVLARENAVTLLMSGDILSVSQLADGRIVYNSAANGMRFI